jgi:hypothetical protein
VPYFESSAKERLNVEESFHELVSMCFCFQPLPTFTLLAGATSEGVASALDCPPCQISSKREKENMQYSVK